MNLNLQLYLEAKKDIGIQEIPGSADEARIMEMFRLAGHSWVNSETTPWCSAAMNAWCRRLGLPSTGSLRARSWLDLAEDASTWGPYSVTLIDDVSAMAIGDIAILWREKKNSAKGHVALWEGRLGSDLFLFGGNQSNAVRTKRYKDYRFLAGLRFEPRT